MNSPQDLFSQLSEGNRAALARAITLIESRRPRDFPLKQELILLCGELQRSSIRVAVSGLPGAGKSSFIEQLGLFLTGLGHRVAVLAVDPSSDVSGGSIMGDKTRMEQLALEPNAYIRPSPNSGILGGVNEMTREAIIVCEAAGFEVILVETVGVGQAEYGVRSMTDLFLLLTISGAGDLLQGIKRGIMEMADLVVVNKADGENIESAQRTATDLKEALRLSKNNSESETPVITVSSLTQDDFEAVWTAISTLVEMERANGLFEKRRADQSRRWFEDAVKYILRTRIEDDPTLREVRKDIHSRIGDGTLHPLAGAEEYVDRIVGRAEH